MKVIPFHAMAVSETDTSLAIPLLLVATLMFCCASTASAMPAGLRRNHVIPIAPQVLSSRTIDRAKLMRERRQKAEAWVAGYTATAVGTVVATALVPGAATVILTGLEATMCYQIGRMYRVSWTPGEAATAAGVVGMASFAGKIVALEGAIVLGPLGVPVKAAIAGTIVQLMGQLVIKHFEDTSD